MIKWVDKFQEIAKSNYLHCYISHIERGWIETILINGQKCFCRSKTYDDKKREYYIGVDPRKLNESGDFVLICGGDSDGRFRDIFLIPWERFFGTLRLGDPKNTYKAPREYIQYRTYLRDRNNRWAMSVQPAGRKETDISEWRYSVDEAIKYLKSKE